MSHLGNAVVTYNTSINTLLAISTDLSGEQNLLTYQNFSLKTKFLPKREFRNNSWADKREKRNDLSFLGDISGNHR